MEQNKENVVEEVKETERPFSEHLAMEMLKNERGKHKAKDIAVICLTAALIVIAIGLSIINYKNDVDWRALFSDYDFISQDGEGINNVNGGTQGDLLNGAESEVKEGQE